MQYLITQGIYTGHTATFRAHWDKQNIVVWIDDTIDSILPLDHLQPLNSRSQKWHSKTKVIRVPIHLEELILEFAHNLEEAVTRYK